MILVPISSCPRSGELKKHCRAQAERWAALRDEIGRSFARTDALNLDRKQTILGAFFAIAGALR